jgi:hypothetical protein
MPVDIPPTKLVFILLTFVLLSLCHLSSDCRLHFLCSSCYILSPICLPVIDPCEFCLSTSPLPACFHNLSLWRQSPGNPALYMPCYLHFRSIVYHIPCRTFCTFVPMSIISLVPISLTILLPVSRLPHIVLLPFSYPDAIPLYHAIFIFVCGEWAKIKQYTYLTVSPVLLYVSSPNVHTFYCLPSLT